MIDNIKKEDCTGCGACFAVCPVPCIDMLPDSEGFFYPKIQFDKCIKCHLCDKVCPVNINLVNMHSSNPTYFSTSINDDAILQKSSSGGVFSVLAKSILAKGGYVCGCVFNEDMIAEHICTDSWDEVRRMQGAKYVQSNSFSTFAKIKELLKNQKPVLFSGTPCQVDGLRSFLSKQDTSKLVTVDMICHGVPSRLLLKSYTDSIERKYRGQIKKLEFRNKEKRGWGAEHHTCIEIQRNGKIKRIFPPFASFFTIFFWGVAMRPSCYSCIYTKPRRVSDLTLGDFWGADESYGVYLKKGISIVSINSETGRNLFDEIRPELAFSREQRLETVIKGNIHLTKPVSLNPVRNYIYEDLRTRSYSAATRRVLLSKECRSKLRVSLYRGFVPDVIKRWVTAYRHPKGKNQTKGTP